MTERTPGEDGAGIVALVFQLSKAFNRHATEDVLGMRLKEFLVLSYLRDKPGTSQQELGEAMLLESNTVVLLLNELESKGLLIRTRDAVDRRRHVVELTASGRAALGKAEKARETVEDQVLAGLSAEERRTLRRVLIHAIESQSRIPAPVSR